MGGGGGSRYSRRAHNSYTAPTKNSNGSLPLFEEDDCISFSLNTRLQNPQTALSNVQKGDLLSVQLESESTIAVLNNNGEVCGNIAHPKAPKLATCLKKGNKFSATVMTIEGNVCDVFIKNIKS